MEHATQRFIPVLPIRNTVIFPGVALPLRVGRQKSMAAVKLASQTAKSGDWIVTVAQKTEREGDPTPGDLYNVGTLAKIEKVRGNSEDGYQVLVRGVARFRIDEWVERDGAILALGEEWKDFEDADASTLKALSESLKTTGREILDLLPSDTTQLQELLSGIEDLSLLTHLCAGNSELELSKKQELLETPSLKNRALQGGHQIPKKSMTKGLPSRFA